MRSMSREIRVAIAGVGNTASTFLQGLAYYRGDASRPGLWHPNVGGYGVADVNVVAAFDVNAGKVDAELSKAVFAAPNLVPRYVPLQETGVRVSFGVLDDPLPETIEGSMQVKQAAISDVADELKNRKTNVFVNLVSSGLHRTSRAYAEAALRAGCSFVNATPSPIVSDVNLVEKFRSASLVVAGDDLMTQFGGTAYHRGILSFMDRRGIRIVRSYQLDVGGGEETLATLDEGVKAAKRKVKTNAISVEVPYSFDTVAGTTDFVDFLGDRRNSYFWIEGEGFLGEPVKIDIYLRTSDGANAGNILLDTIRATQASRDRRIYGAPNSLCAYGFKNPPAPTNIDRALQAYAEEYLSNA